MNTYQQHEVDDDLPNYPEEIYASPMRRRFLRLAPTTHAQCLRDRIGAPEQVPTAR